VLVRRRPGDEAGVARTRVSLRAQTYRRFACREAPEGEAGAAPARGSGELAIAIDAGDALAPHALFAIAATGDAGAELFYFDEDRLAGSLRGAPWFKPGWSPEELESHDHTAAARAFRRDLLVRAGVRDLAAALPSFRRVRHVPDVLLHRREDAPLPQERLAPLASRPEIGLVGAQLVYPDDTIQHGGVVVGMTGFAGHLFQGCLASARTRFGPTHVTRNCSSVMGACMLVRREVFQRLGGFDERFVLCGSDVALGLRAMSAGLRNAVTPEARLVHPESRIRGAEVPASYRVSLEVCGPWLRAGDPYYNPNLSLRDGTCRLRLAREDMLARARWMAR
jgi:hypothetical protein